VGLIESEKTYFSSGAASGAYSDGIVPAFHTQALHFSNPSPNRSLQVPQVPLSG